MRFQKLSFLVFFAVIFLMTSFVSASFTLGNLSHSITGIYGPGDNIRGWVNLSFNNEPANVILKDSKNNQITLMDLLNNGSYVYSCNPLDCSSDYSATSGASSKTVAVGGNSTLVGLKFTGKINSVDSVSFSINSNVGPSCQNQISVDILNDGTTEITNENTSDSGCSNLRSYGCFDSSAETEEYTLGSTTYCQKVSLSNSPGFTLGAWIKQVSGNLTLEEGLYTLNGQKVARCTLIPNSTEGEATCSVTYPVTKTDDYYVCVYSTSGSGTYKIRGNTNPVNSCGFPGLPPPGSSTPAAYQIFAEGKGFGSVGNMQVSNDLQGNGDFSSVVSNYLLSKYNGDCSNGCVVPIRISGANQQAQVYNLTQTYTKDKGVVTENNIYDVEEKPTEITSGFQKINLDDAGFLTPSKTGTYKFILSLDNKELFTESVNVSDIPRVALVYPLKTAAAYPTEFIAVINSSGVPTKYFWNFNDGSIPEVTLTNKVTHTYSAIGNYELTVKATDSRGLGSERSFDVNVTSPKDLINATIAKTRDNIQNVKTQISGFSPFAQDSISSFLQLDGAVTEINALQTNFSTAQTEDEYNAIITELLKWNVPNDVSEGVSATGITFFPTRNDINLGAVASITNSDYDSSRTSDYENAIVAWNLANIDSRITYSEFVGDYDGEFYSFMKVFNINIIQKQDISGNYFLVVPKLDNLKFDQDLVVKDVGDYVYVDITGKDKVSFSTTSNVDFTNVPAFITPEISSLSLTSTSILGENQPKWAVLVLVLLFLLIVAFIVYVILQEWYKRRYENYLFKNRNDLYNIATYINNSKKKGMENKEISANLKKAKWNSEQIRYAMRKYAGKRTGMIEIPGFGSKKKDAE